MSLASPPEPAWSDTQPLYLPWLRPAPTPGPPVERPVPPPPPPRIIDPDRPGWPEQVQPCHPVGWTVFFRAGEAKGARPTLIRTGVVAGPAIRDPDTNVRRTPVLVCDDVLGDKTVLVADSAITTAMPTPGGRHRG